METDASYAEPTSKITMERRLAVWQQKPCTVHVITVSALIGPCRPLMGAAGWRRAPSTASQCAPYPAVNLITPIINTT